MNAENTPQPPPLEAPLPEQPDLKTLFITTSRQGRSPQELAQHPDAGCVFAMRMEVAGLPVNEFMV